jgi:hypothetical protein
MGWIERDGNRKRLGLLVAEDPPADPEVWGLVKPPGSNS